MEKKKIPRPTDTELEILSVLWQQGPCSVREVHDQLGPRKKVGYTTILKMMQIMKDKGLLIRDEKNRTHIYSTRLKEEETQGRLVKDLLDRAFKGSAMGLVLQVLSAGKSSPEELSQIRSLLDRLEEESHEKS